MTAQKLRIAAIGDSLTQGFMSGAISRTTVSFPSLIASTFGLGPDEFRVPRFPGSGIPLNIESFLRFASRRLGPDISGAREWIFEFPDVFSDFADSVEDLYERGAGSRPSQFGGIYHNLAVWGFRVQDAYTVTPQLCRDVIKREEGFINDDFLGLPSGAMYRTAHRVLNPRQLASRDDTTQVSAVKQLIESEGLDVLIVFLGANDCLGTVLSLQVNDMADSDTDTSTLGPVKRREQWNLTSAEQFEEDYAELVERLKDAMSGVPKEQRPKIILGNVPHVTIPPVSRGIGAFDGQYFEHYGRFFASEDGFSPFLSAHITGQQAKMIDKRIDSFNAVIRKTARRNKWQLVDVAAGLDMLAVRRNGFEAAPGMALRDYFAKKGMTDHPLLGLSPTPSILRLQTQERGKVIGGGLFSLDCVHPSTIGYGLVAEMFLEGMQEAGVSGADPRKLNWRRIIAQDSLWNSAPSTWDDVVDAAENNPLIWDTLFSILG